MSYVVAIPEAVNAAAAKVAGFGAALSKANSSAALATTGLLAAGSDEVSAAIASLFSAHGQGYQQVAAQMTAFHDRFVQALTAGGGAYAHAEAANASPCRPWSKTCSARSTPRPRPCWGVR